MRVGANRPPSSANRRSRQLATVHRTYGPHCITRGFCELSVARLAWSPTTSSHVIDDRAMHGLRQQCPSNGEMGRPDPKGNFEHKFTFARRQFSARLGFFPIATYSEPGSAFPALEQNERLMGNHEPFGSARSCPNHLSPAPPQQVSVRRYCSNDRLTLYCWFNASIVASSSRPLTGNPRIF